MEPEAGKKELIYKKVDPDNIEQMEDLVSCEREGFGVGLDPQELPPVLRFIAKNGHIWLQYVREGGKLVPTGFIELIPLMQALEYLPERIDKEGHDLAASPFNVIMENQRRVFANVRKFTKDKDIVYYHGIATARRGGGYGTLLLRHALENTPCIKNRTVVCFPDAAQIDRKTGGLNLAPNESSFTLHLKAGFVLTGVVEPPVYDETIVYYSFVKPPRKVFKEGGEKEICLNLKQGPADEILEEVQKHTSQGYLGVSYSKETHEMRFVLSQSSQD